ncbi:MAG: sugar ABC transporter permease [Clostridia bacterium]|nr:sugar ABC transporter permease [Clostridia bacterium]
MDDNKKTGGWFTEAVLNTFFKEWVWNTFCVKWFWKSFCVNLVYKKFDKWKAWIYLVPAIVLLLVFTVWPIINTVRIAFLDGYSILGEVGGETYSFGISNFLDVLDEYSGFGEALKNTLWLTFITVPLSTILALIIAVCLNSIKPLQKFLQTIFFLPYVTNSIAIGMVFEAMFNIVGLGTSDPSFGIINNILGVFGLDPINWININSSYWANMAVMIIYIVWNALPFKILILLGGLQSVNKQYYDAAKIDSTPRIRVFTRITVPLLSPMIAYVVITGFIGGFKEYSSIVGIFGDDMQAVGTEHTLNTMVGYIYDALGNNEGRASAAALILFAIIFVVTMINLRVSKKKTHY